jgi:excisionase family DNA binding protein
MAGIANALNDLTLTIAETAKVLGIGLNQAYEAAHRGEIPTIKIGSRILVPKAALEKMLGLRGC